MRNRFAIFLPALLLALACGGDPAGEPGSQTTAAQIDMAEVERLRALGYVGVGQALPPDAPVGVLAHDESRAAPGLNLFTNAHFCSTQLMDMAGRILHTWSHEPCFRWGNALLAPNGDLIVLGRLPHEQTPQAAHDARYLLRMDWSGEILWKKAMPVHHDVDLAPDGRILTLAYELRIDPELDPEIPVRDNSVLVLDGGGELLERVSLRKMLQSAPELFTMQPGKARWFEGSQEIDLLHSNSVEWMRLPELAGRHAIYGESTVLVCIRNQDTLAIFDWPARKLLWAWGQGELSGPHDATLLPNGNILAFDNGLGRDWSRVIEVDPIAREIVWQWRANDPQSFYSTTRGSNQRLSNGNTLIVESDDGRVFEVDPGGRIVWEFLNSNLTDRREPSVIVRMRRFEGIDYARLAESITSGGGLSYRVD